MVEAEGAGRPPPPLAGVRPGLSIAWPCPCLQQKRRKPHPAEVGRHCPETPPSTSDTHSWAWPEFCWPWSFRSQAGMGGCLLHRLGEILGLLYLPICSTKVLGSTTHYQLTHMACSKPWFTSFYVFVFFFFKSGSVLHSQRQY
jgi:hypothetical protein